MTMRTNRSLATLLALLIYVQPLAQNTFAFTPSSFASEAAKAPKAPEAPKAPKAAEAPKAPESPKALAEQAPSLPVIVFGPAVYTRSTGSPNIYDVTFSKPAWMTGPYTLHVVNGTAAGLNRLSSSTIVLNGVEVVAATDFGQSVAAFDKDITLLPENTMRVRVTSVPLGFMTVSIVAQNGDRTPPVLTFVSPVSGGFSNTATTQIVLRATDALGIGEPGLSGTLASSLAVAVDGTDHSSLFSLVNGDFVGNVPALPEGTHAVSVSIADVAGNTGSASLSFTIDRTPPQIVIVDPAAGQYTNATMIDVSGGVIDATPTTVLVDGAPATVTGSEFVAGAVPVGAGPSQAISIQATDAAGNTATAAVTINIDRAPPALAITAPAAGAVLTGPIVDVSGTVSDTSTVVVAVNGEQMTVANGSFSGQVPASDGTTVLRAEAHDAAGNQSTAERTILIDSVAPVIAILEPANETITNQASMLIRGSVSDASLTVVRAGGAEAAVTGGLFEATLPLPSEGSNVLIVTATDAAGNESMAAVTVISDRSAPVLAITSPAAGAVVPALPVTVQGTVQDLTGATVFVNGSQVAIAGATWETTLENLPEGDTTVSVVARDAAGNESSASRTLTIDLNAPIVAIDTPQSAFLTAEGAVAVAGTVQDVSVSQVLVNGVAAALAAAPPGNAPRAFTATVSLAEGDNAIVATAKDGAGREGSAQVMVTRDSTPPAIALTVGPKVTRTRPAAASVIATDNLALDRVTVSVNGTLVQTFTAPPFVLDLSAPSGARPGDVLAVVAEATDRVGNKSQSTASLPVASDGAIVGQVLSDVTGRPIPLIATVSVDNAPAIATDESGRYSFATGEQRIGLTVSAVNMTSVDRVFDVASETGTVAVDTRLTPLAPATTVGAASSTIAVAQTGAPGASVALSLLVPGGAYPDGSSINATALSGQGLPGLLPLGWSPIAALDLRGPAPATAVTLRAELTGGASVPSAPSATYLARYINRSWYLASDVLTPDANGAVTVPMPLADAIAVALVIPDSGEGAPTVPAIGDPLPGVAAVAIPLTATSAGVLDPPVLSPGGGTSIGTLTITSPTALPSGTIVQAVVTETFTLAGGDTISTDARNQDFVIYRTFGTQQNQTSGTPGTVGTLGTVFPVVPSRSFSTAELVSGIVHLDILAGRESVRGLAGGSGAVTLTTTGATLAVAQGALTDDVPITFQSAVLSSFLPVTADVAPLLEFSVDFSGRTLATAAELSVLAAQLANVAAEDAIVVVRVDSIEGRSRLVPVAIGELSGDRYIARARHGLSGITRGGRHVWYRVGGGVGFIRGIVDAGGSGLSAIVEAAGLPFTTMAATDGHYSAIARPGAVTVRARAPGTSLVGEASTPVTVNSDAALSISLNGEVTAATITPANNAVNVPVGVQVEVASPASIAAASLAAATITFLRTSDPSGAVPYRMVLSGSGRTLAIVPLTRLAEGATYSVQVVGLADAVGGAVSVPPTAFTTQSTTSPQYDLDKLVFSFPNEQGEVILNGPPGTLAPGSSILVVNESTGEVSTLGVNNDGSVSEVGGRLVANISDRLIVTITDLQGRQTVFKRSEYVAEDGTTAVGNGGGEIVAPGGVEVRIPEDAVMNGVAAILKIAAISPDQLPSGPLPDLPGATVSTSLKLESPDPPQFQKEVDLVFPKPADAPDDATYFVYRRMEGPDGKIAYESIDFAAVEGEGENAKVVTASYPFSGYVSSINGYNASGLDFGGGVSSQLTNYAILMFHYDQLMPGKALGGVITGKVLRPKWNPGATTPTYEPVAGAIVSGVDAAGDPLFASGGPDVPPTTIATSQADGTYSLYDRQYTGGAVTMSATYGGQTFKATAYEADPQNTKSPGLRFARNVATANITFPAVAPTAPPSPVIVAVMTLDANGARKNSTGIVVAGEPLVIGVKAGGLTVQRIEVKSGTQTTEFGVRIDPQAGQNPAAFEVIADGAVSFALPGSYTLTATALNPDGGVAVGHVVVRAAAAGGGNNDSLPNDAPAVITARTSPKADAVGVQIGALPQIVFTEPVQNVPAGVTLTEDGGGTIGIMLSGVGPNGPIAELTAASVVTSITIQPTAGLKFGTRYTLALSSAIVDTDDGANNTQAQKPLEPYSISFTTFAPESIGQTADNFTAGGMAVIGDRAYIATPQSLGRWFTNLRLFDISDPTAPQEIGSDTPSASQVFKAPPAWWLGLPVDVAVDQESVLTGGPVVAVAVTPLAYPYHTSNVRLYDVSNEQQWRWIGAVSLGREPSDGMIRRIEMKGSMLYAVTAGIGKGIQFVDLGAVQGAFDTALAQGEQSAAYWSMLGQLNSMEGFAQEAIVQTLPVNTGSGDNSQLWDLAVTDLPIGGITQTAVVATGRSPLVIASQTDGLLYNGEITDGQGGGPLTSWGYGVAAGTVAGMPIAAVAAIGVAGPSSSSNVLAIVDLTNPAAPRATKVVPLPGSGSAIQDVVLRDTNVFVATNAATYIVNVADPQNPQYIGTLAGVAGRLAFGADGLIYGTYRGLTQTSHADGGLKSTALSALAFVSSYQPDPITVSAGNEVFRNTDFNVRLIPPDPTVTSSNVHIAVKGAQEVVSLPAPLTGGQGTTRWPQGTIVDPSRPYVATVKAIGDGQTYSTVEKPIRFDKVPLAITTRDRLLRIQFALAEQGMFTERKYGVQVFLAQPGGAFSSAPAFALRSDQIERAYANVEVWWNDVTAGSESAASFVTRKIDTMALPPGTNRAIRRQGFEIGAVLAGYPNVRVVVISEDTGVELAREEGLVTPDGAWSGVLTRVSTTLLRAAGNPVSDDPPLPPTTFEPAKVFEGFSGLAYRAVYELIESAVGTDLVRGFVDGFIGGWQGDVDTVVMLRDALASPIETAKLVGSTIKELIKIVREGKPGSILQDIVKGIASIDVSSLLQSAPYYGGYLIGFLLEQVIVKALLTMTGIGVVAVASSLLRGSAWVATLSMKIMALIRTLTMWAETLAKAGAQTSAARNVLGLLRVSEEAVERLWKAYPNAGAMIRRVAEASERSGYAVGGRLLHWVSYVDNLSDDGAARLVAFVERTGAAGTDRLMGSWITSTRLADGVGGVRHSFNDYPNMATASEGVQDALVASASYNRSIANTSVNPSKGFIDKQMRSDGDHVQSALGPLRANVGDTTIKDEAMAATIKVHSRAEIPPVSDEAVRGSARIANVPCPLVASAALPFQLTLTGCGAEILEQFARDYPHLLERFEASLAQLERAGDVSANQAFVKIAGEARTLDPDVMRAVFYAPSALQLSPTEAAEYFKAVDRMRGPDNRLKIGILESADGPGASANIKRVGDRNTGSVAEAYEMIAASRLIDNGTLTLDQISQFGRKIEISQIPDVTTGTIEADVWLTDGTLMDMKHSIGGGTPTVTAAQIDNLRRVLSQDPSPITRAVFVVSADLGPTALQRISDANALIRQARGLPDSAVLIQVLLLAP